MKSLLLALAPSLALAASPPDLKHRPKLAPPPAWSAPLPSSVTTPTGTRVVVVSTHELPLVHVLVTVAAGSALDPPDRPGLAAAVAMMLQDGGAGTRSAPELAQALADIGIEIEERIDGDEVQLTFAVLSTHLDRALALVGDMLARPRFAAAEWPRAQARRIDEIRRRLDEPAHLADDIFERVLYGDHPYGHPTLGTQASVAAITVDDLRKFYAAHYGPRTVGLVLVGDAEASAAANILAKALSNWQASATPPPAPPAPQPRPARLVVVDRPGAPQSQLRVGFLGADYKTPDFAALTLLETVLGGSFTSRLNQNLREKHGYTYGARAHFDLRAVAGTFACMAGVRTDVTGPALDETLRELAGMRAPLPPAELDKGRALVLSAVVEAFADGRHAATYLADVVTYGLPNDFWSKLPAALAALDVPSVTKAAARLFAAEPTIVIVGDRKTIEPQLAKLPSRKTIEHRDVEGRVIQ